MWWVKEPGARVSPLTDPKTLADALKVQAPGAVALPGGGFRLFYTAAGTAKPFPNCQGQILSAVSVDGLAFTKELGVRVAPQPEVAHCSLRVLAPTVIAAASGGWRMYFEARGNAALPTVICSAFCASDDMQAWQHEPGVRLQHNGFSVRGPRIHPLPGPDGGVRLYICDGNGDAASASSADGLSFTHDPGVCLACTPGDTHGDFSAVDVIAPWPLDRQGGYTLLFSACNIHSDCHPQHFRGSFFEREIACVLRDRQHLCEVSPGSAGPSLTSVGGPNRGGNGFQRTVRRDLDRPRHVRATLTHLLGY